MGVERRARDQNLWYKDSKLTQRLTLLATSGIAGADFFPVLYDNCTVRDLHARRDLGIFNGSYSTTLAPHDATILLVRSVNSGRGVGVEL